ncbi:putative protein binding protein [Tripterygium wilfordii]|uniref:RING-type domain-containing protein n=1 Tax=Tripterygium wilfordii TaxID=458696 RepID=A0A7J7CKY0_TRIWF|nr:peroxisome biogenesis factor 10-like [Tripterygium wilfordii]KAF5734699.1 putative protein binding protein [Tripterygium wilfordii]
MDLDSKCDAWPLPGIEEDESFTFTCDMFFIRINVDLIQVRNGLDDEIEPDDLETRFVNSTWYVQRELLMNNETSRTIVREKLVELGVPVEGFMVERILNCASSMAGDCVYSGNRVMGMCVSLSAFVDESSEFDVMEDDDEDGEMGASRSAIERLEVVEVEESVKQCAICLEDMVGGSRATRMPCLHLYHGVCIASWLEKSKLCPLCRSEITQL